MGIVYLAREVHLDRPVAIKLLPPERAREASFRERFLREARLAAKLSHPNIIPIHAVEESAGFVYYVMAFVDGDTLTQRVRTRGPLPTSEGTRVLREVAWALAYAHAQGLVHRDVKPDNILLETSTGRVLVADFGIAAAAGAESADGISGTPEFMSPEQALGKALDARSDLYGLGATAFYAFTARFPFEGNSVTEILAKQVTAPAPQLASMGLPVPRKVAALVDRCLAKEPAHRPESAQTLAEQLGVALEQRRELPAALRAFVKRQGRLDGSGTLLTSLIMLPVSLTAAYYLGNSAGFATFFLGFAAAPLAYFVSRARRLMLLGFDHADVGPAFNAEIEQAREELAIAHQSGTRRVERILRGAAIMTGSIWAVSLAVVATWRAGMSPLIFQIAGPTMGVSGAVALLAAITHIALRQRHSDVDSEFWAKVWTSRIGKFVFRVARKLLGKHTRHSAMTHRPTELTLGMAAEQLYESLPKEQRHVLRDLPAVLKRLQDDAQALRRRYDELQDALGGAQNVVSSPEYAELRSVRDAVHAKLGEAVGALETIRLNLLRLHAGSATVEGLTTHLGIAADVSAEVARMIAAHDEMERGLNFPRPPVATPV
jgi:serine/threonine-protein kinase